MLSLKDKIILVLRSFFLQAVFNFEGYQNIGFLYIISYPIKKYIKDAQRVKLIFKRHLEIFNTQPYMSSFVIGNIVKMELDLRDEKDIVNVKQSLACTYASIGDRIFWSRIKVIEAEVTLLITFVLYYCCSSYLRSYYFLWISVIVPVIFYFVYTLYIRYVGILIGLECGGMKNCGLDRFNWNRIIKTLSRIAFFLCVLCILLVLFIYGFLVIKDNLLKNMVYISIPLISFVIQRYFRKTKKNIVYPILFMMIFSFVVSFFIR